VITVGTESIQESARLLTLALKLPATMLQSSPKASRMMDGLDAASPPSMREASFLVVVLMQRIVTMAQSAS
jgi:hypothetical protein